MPRPFRRRSVINTSTLLRQADQPLDVEYTCPMHPEIVQIGPGACPKCGMALEPKEISLDDTPDQEYVVMRRRFWICAVLTIPVFVLAMGEMVLPGFHRFVEPDSSLGFSSSQPLSVVIWGGWPFFQRAWASIKNASPNMFTLIAIGTGVRISVKRFLGIFAPFVPCDDARSAHWPVAGLFRIGGGHNDARLARPGPRTSCPIANIERDQGTASAGS